MRQAYGEFLMAFQDDPLIAGCNQQCVGGGGDAHFDGAEEAEDADVDLLSGSGEGEQKGEHRHCPKTR